MIVIYIFAKRRATAVQKKFTNSEKLKVFLQAIPLSVYDRCGNRRDHFRYLYRYRRKRGGSYIQHGVVRILL